jgi:carbamoyl-phosphate synthase large subunit
MANKSQMLNAGPFLNGTSVSVLEINLRFGGGYPGSHLAGADFPSKIASKIKGEVIKPSIRDYQRVTVMMKDNLIISGLGHGFFNKKISISVRRYYTERRNGEIT